MTIGPESRCGQMTIGPLFEEQQTTSNFEESDTSYADNPSSSKRKRSRNWSLEETRLLVQLKKDEWMLLEASSAHERMESAIIRWQKIAEKIIENGYTDRDANGCRAKYENLIGEYKTIHDFSKRTGMPEYFSLSKVEKKNYKLPILEESIYMIFNSFQSSRPNVDPAYVADTSRATSEGDHHPIGIGEEASSGKRRASNVGSLSKTMAENNKQLMEIMEAHFEKTLQVEKEKLQLQHVLVGAMAGAFEKMGNYFATRERPPPSG